MDDAKKASVLNVWNTPVVIVAEDALSCKLEATFVVTVLITAELVKNADVERIDGIDDR
jgi:hypothetical protein